MPNNYNSRHLLYNFSKIPYNDEQKTQKMQYLHVIPAAARCRNCLRTPFAGALHSTKHGPPARYVKTNVYLWQPPHKEAKENLHF